MQLQKGIFVLLVCFGNVNFLQSAYYINENYCNPQRPFLHNAHYKELWQKEKKDLINWLMYHQDSAFVYLLAPICGKIILKKNGKPTPLNYQLHHAFSLGFQFRWDDNAQRIVFTYNNPFLGKSSPFSYSYDISLQNILQRIDSLTLHHKQILLTHAAYADHRFIAEYLLVSGLNPNFCCATYGGFPPLTYAVGQNRHWMVELLLRHGADIEKGVSYNIHDEEMRKLLQQASKKNECSLQ